MLKASASESLLSTTLETLLRFLNWIPLGYIFETTLMETIVINFFTTMQFRLASLKCLVEMGYGHISHHIFLFLILFLQDFSY